MIYKKDSLTSCLWEGTLYDMLKSAIRGHWDKIILDTISFHALLQYSVHEHLSEEII